MLKILEAYQNLTRPAPSASRVADFTPYEKILRVAIQVQEDYATGDRDLMVKRGIPINGGGACTLNTIKRHVETILNPKKYGEDRKTRLMVLESLLQDMVKRGFFTYEYHGHTSLFRLTTKYLEVDVNTLMKGSDDV
ncbi:hypothetical protein NMN79_004467 [Salmonella enterica]|nr:hypothetical protein [Salmonella enterica]